MIDARLEEVIEKRKAFELLAYAASGAILGIPLYYQLFAQYQDILVPYWVGLFLLSSLVLMHFLRVHFRKRVSAWKLYSDIVWNLLAFSGIASFIPKAVGGEDWAKLVPPAIATVYLFLLAATASVRAAVSIVSLLDAKQTKNGQSPKSSLFVNDHRDGVV